MKLHFNRPYFTDFSLIYRCILDETVKVYPGDSMKYDFEIQAFKFTGGFDEVRCMFDNNGVMRARPFDFSRGILCRQVYISCSVILCAEESPNSRCAQGCLSPTARRRRRDLNQETSRHYIIQGPLRVSRETQHAVDGMLRSGYNTFILGLKQHFTCIILGFNFF